MVEVPAWVAALGSAVGEEAMGELPELRLALAMRGGVSLAVWMGGACSEIDALRRATPSSEPADGPLSGRGEDGSTGGMYAELLRACGYGGVAVDVVAGASAGGLNGALLGCSVVHDMPLGSNIRDLWLTLGDIGALTRPRSLAPAPSLLDGDNRFYAPLVAHLRAFLQGVQPPAAGSVRFDLTLTGTVFHQRPTTRHQDLGEPIVEPRHRARFRFRHLPVPGEPLLCDFGRSGSRDVALARLAYAARATSSFPGAFEPALVGCTELPTGAGGDEQGTVPASGAGPTGPPATLYGVYSESRAVVAGDVQRDLVIDGGVLDNIPVAWAVRSIAAAPADRAVHRWLVYLQPVPFPPVEAADERRPDLRATVKRARRLRSGTETLTDDIDELERLKRARLTHEGFRMVVEYALGEKRGAYVDDAGNPVAAETDGEFLRALFGRALTATASYRDRLGVLEGSRLLQLWTDPQPVLGADPLGYAEFRWINRPASARGGLVRKLVAGAGLADAVLPADAVPAPETVGDLTLEARTSRLIGIGRRIRTPQALARTVAALLDSARDLGAEGLDLKRRLYEQRSRIELLIARHDRHLAAEPAKLGADGVEPVEVARRAARRLADSPDELGASDEVDPGWPERTFEASWTEMVRLATELAAVAAAAGPPQRAVLSCLMSATQGQDRAARVEAALVATELLTGPSRPDPLAETTPIRFHMLSAMNVSPLIERLRREDQRSVEPESDEPRSVGPEPVEPASDEPRSVGPEPVEPASVEPESLEPLSVDDKLAGNQLANFGAFLRARWRQNDWIWGRLDAARSLVELLTAPDPVAPPGTTAPAGPADPPGAEPAGRVDWEQLRVLAGAPAGTSRQEVADALVSKLHERILREELPYLSGLGGGPPSEAWLGEDRPPLQGRVDHEAVLPLLRTGRETVASAVAKDPLRFGIALRLLDLGAIGWTAGSSRAATRGGVRAARRGGAALTDRVRRVPLLRRVLDR
jgi:hypothetical protein